MQLINLIVGALVGVLMLVAGGCGASKPGAVATLNEYSVALRDGAYEHAYEMLSDEFREKIPKEAFVRMMRENGSEVRATADRLRGDYAAVEMTARFRYGKGDELQLVYEHGEWKIARNPVGFYSQATPRDALRSFVRAYENRRWDIMLKLVPNQYAKRMDRQKIEQQFTGDRHDEIELMVRRLQEHIDGDILERGMEARMPYGDDEVKFIREDLLWKIEDPQ